MGSLVCLVGFGVAGYLTYEHFTGSHSLICVGKLGFIDCPGVTTSTYSKFHGIPVAVLGLVLLAVASALDLIYDELFRLDAIGLSCTSVHVVSLLLFISTLFGTASTAPFPAELDDKEAIDGI